MVNAMDCSFFLSNVKEFFLENSIQKLPDCYRNYEFFPPHEPQPVPGERVGPTYIINKTYKAKIITSCRLGLN